MWNDSRCKPGEANVNACRQIGLRGADRREMASTCYIAGIPALFTPQLHDTHAYVNLHASVYLPVSSALSFVLCSCRLAEGQMSSLLLASHPLIFNAFESHTQIYPSLLCPFVFLFVAPSRLLLQHLIASFILHVSYVMFQPPQVWC